MKKMLIVSVLLFACCGQAWAKTDLWGTTGQVSFTGSAENMAFQAGRRPVEDVFVGVALKLSSEALSKLDNKLTDTYVGLALEYPVLSVGSLLSMIDVNGIGYVGVRGLWLISGDNKPEKQAFLAEYVLGVDVRIREKINADGSFKNSTSLRFEYIKPDGKDMYNESRLMAGVMVRWR